MGEAGQIAALIDRYMELLRIRGAADRDAELETQLRQTRAKLRVFGVAADTLVIHQPKP